MRYIALVFLLYSMQLASEPIEPGMIGLAYKDEGSREFLKKVLDSLNKPHTSVNDKSGITIYWKPDDDIQEMEVRNRVGQWYFTKTVCTDLPIPKPEQQSQNELSCTE